MRFWRDGKAQHSSVTRHNVHLSKLTGLMQKRKPGFIQKTVFVWFEKIMCPRLTYCCVQCVRQLIHIHLAVQVFARAA
jgi:hypothetical protein